ncbi:hypothetical protein P152DRAFT_471913 [Eremomyces bilateralis CBS 781.70]|uniref:Uncharacterized protein n=1 Tax=Eremomyces bilateralis CBS 781.70 TaxID=1392243 RepID=A0A6G1G7Z8_9PEZI|nr:uncharacterized protein P152DRAFT_471913 [Eremomyces bilateralis CBS 781.70]KAF1814122.1 hypothetical protein P152DRAFT_471913 [Eremomyces bilateralis CBS 781.70]
MAPPDPSISWLQAFQILPILALSTMTQPVGRVLGFSVSHSFWLRASPFICAFDVLALAIRFLTYCVVLRATPRKAMLIIGMDRFDEAKIDHSVRKTARIATILRLFGFFLSILPLTYVVGAWGDIRWTVAWAWLYAASYVILEIASQLARSELSKPQYTPMDFELDEIVEESDDGETSHADSTEEAAEEDSDQAKPLKDETQDRPEGSASTKYKPGRTGSETGSIYDESNSSTADQVGFTASASTEHLLGEGIDGSQRTNDDDGSTLAQAETTESTNEGPPDLEAAKNSYSEHANPVTSPRSLALRQAHAAMDETLFKWCQLLHTIFLYWAFLDLIQPFLNRHILASSSWEAPIFLLSLPLIYACLFFAMLGLLGGWHIMSKLVTALVTFARLYLPPCMQVYASKVVTTVYYGLCVLLLLAGSLAGFFIVEHLLLSEYMVWLYGLLSVEAVVLAVFCSVCFGLYILLKFAAEASTGVKEKLGVSGYLDEDGVALLTVVLVTFTVSILWYRFRYASAAHWTQDWRDALVVNTTTTNSTMTNTTTTS